MTSGSCICGGTKKRKWVLPMETGVLFSITGSPRLQFYNTDFGWGRPRKVEHVSIEKSGAFSLSDPREGIGGVEIGLVLKKQEIEAFASLFASGLNLVEPIKIESV